MQAVTFYKVNLSQSQRFAPFQTVAKLAQTTGIDSTDSEACPVVSVRGDVREYLNNLVPSQAPTRFGSWDDSQAAHVANWARDWASDCAWAEDADGSSFEERCEDMSAVAILRAAASHYAGGLSALVRDSLHDCIESDPLYPQWRELAAD